MGRTHEQPPRRAGRRRLSAATIGIVLLGLAAALGLAARASAVPGDAPSARVVVKGHAASPAGPVFAWNDGTRTQTAWLATDEVAVFLESGVPTDGAGARLTREANAGRSVEGRPEGKGTTQVIVPVAKLPGEAPAATLRRVRAALLADPAVADVGAVLYQGPRTRAARLVGTGEIIVRFRADVTVARQRALLTAAGLTRLRAFPFLSGGVLARAAAPLDVFAAAESLRAGGEVLWTAPSWYREREKRAVPNDPYFAQQWHLRNLGGTRRLAGVDVDVLSVWDELRGTQQVIAVADDGVQVSHPDLAANMYTNTATTGSFDWVDHRRDPSPALPEDDHGTACAGVAAAAGFNGIGVSGVAPAASLIGYRFLDADNDANEGEVLANHFEQYVLGPQGDPVPVDIDNRAVVDVTNSSWGPTDDRHLEAPGPLAAAALADGVSNGRGGKGTIYVWAAGNGRQLNDNVNFDGYANSRYTIPVGAVTAAGKLAPYSEDGAPLRVCAPSSDDYTGIVTTDRTGAAGYNGAASPGGDYTGGFGGTSAAAPEVCGVVALMLQANPQLGWRDVQQILMTTARKVDPASPGWTTNAAGYHVSHSYGFGLVDAAAAVQAAATWAPVGPERSVEGSANVGLAIPDASGTGIASTIRLDASTPALRIEYVEVFFTAQHPYWSDLQVTLTAPSGTQSVLATSSGFDGGESPAGYQDWRFGTARDLGESSRGTWTLRVRDLQPGIRGTFVGWRVKVYGTLLPDDTTPPVTRVAGTPRLWWNSSPTIQLAAVDLGSNVLRTEHSIDGSADGPYRTGTTVKLAAPATTHANDGRHVVWYRSLDNAEPPNVETARTLTVNIDTRPPRTQAPRAAATVSGRPVRLFYRVIDPYFSAHKAVVRIAITGAGGRLVKTLSLGYQPTGLVRNALFSGALPRGTYRFTVYATDPAGNRQSAAGYNYLVIR